MGFRDTTRNALSSLDKLIVFVYAISKLRCTTTQVVAKGNPIFILSLARTFRTMACTKQIFALRPPTARATRDFRGSPAAGVLAVRVSVAIAEDGRMG